MSQRLVGYIQVLLQHQQRYDALASAILELRYKFVRVLYDALGLVGVRYVVVELFCQVGKVGFHLNVVIVWDELALHEPCLPRRGALCSG